MSFETILTALFVGGSSLGVAIAIVAAVVTGQRDAPPPAPDETQDEFTAAVLKWGDMQDRMRK